MIAVSEMRQDFESFIKKASENFERRFAEAKCKTCLDEKKITEGSRMIPCPSCNFESVEEFGFRTDDGSIIDREVASKFISSAKIIELLSSKIKSRILVGPPLCGKTVYLRLCYNHYLRKFKSRERIFWTDEMDLFRRLKSDGFGSLMESISLASVLIFADAFKESNWMSANSAGYLNSGVWADYWTLIDSIRDARRHIVLVAANKRPDDRSLNVRQDILARWTEIAEIVNV